MKKLIVCLLMLTLVVGCACAFVGCGEKDNNSGTNSGINSGTNNGTSKTISIGVQAGTTGEAYVKGDEDWGFAGIANASVSSYESIGLAINDIKNGSISYAVVDKAVAETLVASNADLIKMVNVDLTVEKYAIGVSKNKTELLNQINTIIAQIKSDGTLDAIYAAYGDIEITNGGENGSAPSSEVYVGLDNGDSKASNKLILATNAQFAPYEYKIGTKFYGIDMEIAKIIGEKLNLEVIISDMDFSGVVTAVQQGEADIALSCLTVNAVRSKSVTFSDAYEEGAAQVLIVKKSDTAFDACKTAEDVNNVFKNMK